MIIKFIHALSYVSVLFSASLYASSEVTSEELVYFRVSQDAALIKSESDLDTHLKIVEEIDSPLLYLSESGRDEFINSIEWTEFGVGTFSTLPLELELSTIQAYQVLQLFGLESMASGLTHLAIKPNMTSHIEVDNGDLLNDIYSFERELSAIESENYGSARTTELVNDKFEERFSYYFANKETLSDRELLQLRRTIESAFFITLSDKYSSLYESTLYLHSEDPPYQDIAKAFHNHWVTRDFQLMATLNQNFSDFDKENYLLPNDPLPHKKFSTLIVENSQVELVDRSHVLNEEYHLVVVSDPGCWFSQNLYSVYERVAQSVPDSADDLSKQITWLIPQHSALIPEELVALKDDYPSISFEIVYLNSDWQDYISFYQVPVIYTVTEGQFSLDHVGWSQDDDKQRLSALIDVSYLQK